MESRKQEKANKMDRNNSAEDQSDDERQNMPNQAEEYLFSKFDIMNIVMKRRVGGSSDEDSPLKKRKTGNSIETENNHCNVTETGINGGRERQLVNGINVSFDTDKVSFAYNDDAKQRFDTDPNHHRIDLYHSKSIRGLKSGGNELTRSGVEHDLDARSDKNLPHSFSKKRSELISMSSNKGIESESQEKGGTIKDIEQTSLDTKSAATVVINVTEKDHQSSEVRLKISPTVYKNKKHSIDKIRKSDEETNHKMEMEDGDETDGGTTSHLHRGCQENLGVREATSHYFTSQPGHVSKKSRKQTLPKKILKPYSDKVLKPDIDACEKEKYPEERSHSQRESNESSLSLSCHNLDIDKSPNSKCQNLFIDKSHLGHEKSRKQSTPKRKVDKLVALVDNGSQINKAKEQLKSNETFDGNYVSFEEKTGKGRKQNTPRKIVQESFDADTCITVDAYHDVNNEGETNYNKNDPEMNDFSSDDSKDSSDNSIGNTDANQQYDQDHVNKFTSPYFPNLDLERSFVTPELARLSQQIALQAELMAKLSQSHVQMTESHNSDSDPSASDSLAFVKKLREIRVNRYRKISISEKKHIAGFAKIHGISAAANYFGVSKSAVSLWNRTDFSEKDDEFEKRKRNCFIGNEKFENLVQRVKLEKPTKFKYLSRDDKVEVAKYAKLVGVREMSRCLNMALGTVSGWMRQFPYEIKAKTEENVPVDEKKNEVEAAKNQFPVTLRTKMEESTSVNDIKSQTAIAIPIKAECHTNIPNEDIYDKTKHDFDVTLNDCAKNNVEDSSLNTAETKIKSCNFDDKFLVEKNLLEKSSFLSEKISTELEKTNVKLEPFFDGSDSPVSNSCMKDIDIPANQGKDDLQSFSGAVNKDHNGNGFDASESAKEMSDKLHEFSAKSENCHEHNIREAEIKENTSNIHVDKKADLGIEADLESLIASSYMKPDLDKCFADIREQIAGTVLEDDAYFEHLFKRVTATRIDKYKSLKRSEKLEIVRYAKRIGVRRIAKIMDLATGTLSGWIIKYQHLLGLVSNANADNNLNSSNQSDIDLDSGNVSVSAELETTQITENQEKCINNLLQTPSSILDNKDSTEVTALKFLLKERFPLLQEKINVARKVKFKNLNIGEKVELVKCAKLVGIRPTARVFQMPLGTLSGWISKYSCFLEPEFQGVSQGAATCTNSNSWLINRLDNSLGRLNESEISTSRPLKIAPHLQWTADNRSEETQRSESPYSKMMNEMAEKSFTNINELYAASYGSDDLSGKTNILNRRLSVDWPKLSSQQLSDSQPDLSWPKLKFPDGAVEDIKVPKSDVGSPNFLLHGYSGSYNDETTKANAQQYMQQFEMIQFANTT